MCSRGPSRALLGKAALLTQMQKTYGASAKIRSYEQKTATQLSGLPGSAAEYDAVSALGKANRYMTRTAATQPLGLALDVCTIMLVTDVARPPAPLPVRIRVQLVSHRFRIRELVVP